MRLAVFRTGRHTDSSGNTRDWTEKDLDAIASKYDPKSHEAPAVIGHPKDNSPAYGWVEKLDRVGEMLYATVKPTVEEFTEMLKKGLFKKRSISLYPDMTLKHIGFLGATPPAVKGLPDFAFSGGEAAVIEFEEVSHEQIREKLHQALNPDNEGNAWVREVFPDKAIIEDNGQLYECPYSVAEDGSVALGERKKVKVAYVPDEGEPKGETPKKEPAAETPEGKEEKPKQEMDMSEQLAAKDAEISALRAEKRKAEYASFCEKLEAEGKLIPAMRPAVLDFMEILFGVESYEFAEGTGKKAAAPVEKFKGFLSGLPKVVEFSEVALKGKAAPAGGSAEKRESLISEYIEENKGVSYKDAVIAVSGKNPELFEER